MKQMNFGQIVRYNREKRGQDKKTLARKLGISEHFVNHIESAKIVPVSPRLVNEIAHIYHIPLKKLDRLAQARNRIGKKYYREYRLKNAG